MWENGEVRAWQQRFGCDRQVQADGCHVPDIKSTQVFTCSPASDNFYGNFIINATNRREEIALRGLARGGFILPIVQAPRRCCCAAGNGQFYLTRDSKSSNATKNAAAC